MSKPNCQRPRHHPSEPVLKEHYRHKKTGIWNRVKAINGNRVSAESSGGETGGTWTVKQFWKEHEARYDHPNIQ